jgi:hypothetical protein
MLQTSRYYMNGAPKTCAYCSKDFPVVGSHHRAWRTSDNRYVCDEFCADGLESSSTPETRARRAS